MSTNDDINTCPLCNGPSINYNIGRVHFGVCHTDKCFWCVGENLFTGWHNEDEAVWRRNIELLKTLKAIDNTSADDLMSAASRLDYKPSQEDIDFFKAFAESLKDSTSAQQQEKD